MTNSHRNGISVREYYGKVPRAQAAPIQSRRHEEFLRDHQLKRSCVRIAVTLAANSRFKKDELKKLLRDPDKEISSAALLNRGVSDEQLMEKLHNGTIEEQLSLMRNKNLGVKHLIAVFENGCPASVMEQAAAHPKITDDIIQKIFGSDFRKIVKMAAAKNPKNVKYIEAAIADPAIEVSIATLANPNLTEIQIKKVIAKILNRVKEFKPDRFHKTVQLSDMKLNVAVDLNENPNKKISAYGFAYADKMLGIRGASSHK